MFKLQRVKRGEPIKAETINALIDAAERVLNARGINGVAVNSTRGGMTVGLVRPIIPGRGGVIGGGTSLSEMQITGYTAGAFGIANTGFLARLIDETNSPTGNPLPVYVRSYGNTVGEFGRLDLTSSNVGPAFAVGDRIWVLSGQYAGVADRLILVDQVRELCFAA